MHKPARVIFWTAAISFMFSAHATAQSLEEEVEALKQGQEQIKNDLAEIKRLIQAIPRTAAAAPAPAPSAGATDMDPKDVNIGASPYLGSADAAVTIIGYSDYQCPFCRRHAQTVLPELVKNYVDAGKVKVVMREYPIESIHARAMAASQAALCAGEQGKYWEMHDAIFANQRQLDNDDLENYAEGIGADRGAFSDCLDSEKYEGQIREDLNEGVTMGVSGTPSFVVGLTDSSDPDKATVSKFIRGAKAYPAFANAIDELLAAEE